MSASAGPRREDRGVSELTSVITLLVVAGVVVAAVGLNVLFVEADAGDGPDATFQFDYIQEQSTLIITHQAGEEIPAGNLLIRGPRSQAYWSQVNSQVDNETLIGPRNTTQISRRNAFGARVGAGDRIALVYVNASANVTAVVDQWNGTG